MTPFTIDPDITKAETPPAWFYRDPEVYARQKERIFARSWQLSGDTASLAPPPDGRSRAAPFTLLPGCLDEPLVWMRDGAGEIACLSNVCTHRGAVLLEEEACVRSVRCRYHGRVFGVDGRVASMPGFEDAAGFPRPEDDLARPAIGRFGPFLFASLAPHAPFDDLIAPMRDRLSFLDLGPLAHDQASARDYEVEANWMLYLDNYLEGLHIAFVHPGLARAIDARDYRVELHPWGSMQMSIAAAGEPCFDPPAGHPEAGARAAGYYFWLYPNTMFNVYPWGFSLNLVEPLGPERTRVSYRFWVLDAALRERGAGAGLHQVEMEDEAVVQSVQRGLRSRLYRRGRYAPGAEKAVHHFHRMMLAALAA